MSLNIKTFGQRLSEKEIPENIKQHFYKKFPNATKAHWEMIKLKYVASFVYDGLNTSVKYDYFGAWFKTETELNLSLIPYKVLSRVNTDFLGYQVNKAIKLDSISCSKEIYKLEMKKNNLTSFILITPDGVILDKNKKSP